MKTHGAVPALCILLWLFLASSLPANAQQVLYDDGPINGEVEAWAISFGLVVTDSFTIAGGPSTVTGMSFGAWLFPGDVLESAELSMTSSEFGGTTYFDQVVSFTTGACSQNSLGFNVCEENSTFQGPTLNNGTYWMTLQNAVVNTGDPVYWDENEGIGCQSQGCPSQALNSNGSVPAESFTVLGTQQTGTTGTTPEPAALLLFGTGVVGILGIFRRKLP